MIRKLCSILKIVASSTLMLAYIFMPTCVFAKDNIIIHSQDNGITYLEDESGKLHYYFNAYGEPISVEEALHESLEPVSSFEEPAILNEPVKYNTAQYDSQTKTKGTRKKVSPDVKGAATINYGNTVTTTASWSVSLGATLKAKVISEINIHASFAYTSSSSLSSNFNATYSIPSGKTGAVYFTPYVNKAKVKTWDASGNYNLVTVTYPVKLVTGFTDGIYELVTW